MSRVSFDISMSLDGFIAADNQRPDEPLGEGGQRLHDWAFASDDDRDRAVLTGGVEGAGAMIAGRWTYDDSLPWWKADGPTGRALPQDVPAGSPGRRLAFGDFSRVAVDPGECRS